MALRTPSHYDEEKSFGKPDTTPSGDPSDPRVYKPSETRGVYDDQKPAVDASDPRASYNPQKTALGDSSDPRSKKLSADDLASQEKLTGEKNSTKAALQEQDSLGISRQAAGGFYRGNEAPSRITKFRGKFTRKRVTTVSVGGVVVGASIFGFSIIQGPFQFIHLAQLLQKFHLSENQEFGDSRASTLLLASLGREELSRLGATANIAANAYEKKLLDNSGLRPVYLKDTRRGQGFIFEDQNKALRTLGLNSTSAQEVERLFGKGVRIVSVKEARADRPLSATKKSSLRDDQLMLDFGDIDIGKRRPLVKKVYRTAFPNGGVAAIGSRLSIKRWGANFHILHNDKIRDRRDQKAIEEHRRKIEKSIEDSIANGVEKSGVRGGSNTDENGNPVADESGANVEGETAKALEQYEKDLAASEADGGSGDDPKTVRLNLIKGGAFGGAAAVGVLCSAKDFGNNVEDYKYTNNMLPMMRLGWIVVAMGNQVMSGDGFNLDELSVMSDRLYDEKTKTHAVNAKSIQSQLGKPQSGTELPPEAQLKNVSDKPDFFEDIDKIPGLGTACGVGDWLGGLPVIKQASGLVNTVTEGLINGGLAFGGTNIDELTNQAIAAVAGDSVNKKARGGEFGALADTGLKLAATDQSLTMAAEGLSPTQSAELREKRKIEQLAERSEMSITERYLDPYNAESLTGKAIDSTPSSVDSFAALVNPIKVFGTGFSNLFSVVDRKVQAAEVYDYGIKDYGYSQRDQDDERFQDPLENARIVEPNLDQGENLNGKYGKCFGVTVSIDDSGVHLNNGEAVNVFKLEKNAEYAECRGNETELFKRYRFYLADAQIALSLACYEGEQAACSEMGIGGAATGSDAEETTQTSGESVDVSQLGKNSDKIACAEGTTDLGVVTTKYTGELKKESGPLKIRLCQVKDIPGYGNNTDGVNISGGATVDARVSGAWAALAAKAKSDGVKLTSTSSFRLADSCGGTGDGTACARPGQSFHQTGLAIDLGNMGVKGTSTTSCAARARASSAEWKWMYENAENYGIKQYTYEAWHWDPSGLPNRCGKDS